MGVSSGDSIRFDSIASSEVFKVYFSRFVRDNKLVPDNNFNSQLNWSKKQVKTSLIRFEYLLKYNVGEANFPK